MMSTVVVTEQNINIFNKYYALCFSHLIVRLSKTDSLTKYFVMKSIIGFSSYYAIKPCLEKCLQ